MNKPYVKQYDGLGVLTNPITKDNPYVSKLPNRAARRSKIESYMNERIGKTNMLIVKTEKPLTITKFIKYKQEIKLAHGGVKIIYHTIMK